MKGHGVVTVGGNVPTAVATCLLVEQAAKQQIMAATLGTPELLPKELRDYRWGGGGQPGVIGGARGGGAFLWHQLVWEGETGRTPRMPDLPLPM